MLGEDVRRSRWRQGPRILRRLCCVLGGLVLCNVSCESIASPVFANGVGTSTFAKKSSTLRDARTSLKVSQTGFLKTADKTAQDAAKEIEYLKSLGYDDSEIVRASGSPIDTLLEGLQLLNIGTSIENLFIFLVLPVAALGLLSYQLAMDPEGSRDMLPDSAKDVLKSVGVVDEGASTGRMKKFGFDEFGRAGDVEFTEDALNPVNPDESANAAADANQMQLQLGMLSSAEDAPESQDKPKRKRNAAADAKRKAADADAAVSEVQKQPQP